MKRKLKVFFTAAAVACSSSSGASLIGDTVTCQFSTALACSTSTAVVTPAPEFTLNFISGINAGTPVFVIDIGSSSVQIADIPGDPFNFAFFVANTFVLTLQSLDASAGDIVGIANVTANNAPGMTASDVTFGPDFVKVDFGPANWNNNSSVRFDLVFAGGNAVPEPISLALVGAGLAVIGMRRTQKKTIR
jgi:hypothetical protein